MAIPDRQILLLAMGASAQQKADQAKALLQSTNATAIAAQAAISSAKAQLQFILGQEPQLAANVDAAKAALTAAELSLSYTKITAPFDGVVSERQVHVGDYVTVGTNSIAIVPLPSVYLVANFKETQLSRMKEGQPVSIAIDAFPGEPFTGRVTRLSPASGSQFALLVQRVAVRIDFDASPNLERLRSGMSAVVSVTVSGKSA